MNPLWSDKTNTLQPYTPGEQPKGIENLIKINTNECPYPPSPKVLAAIREAASASLRLYPDPEGTCARAAFAKRNGLDISQVFVGNGSDEVLGMAFLAFFDKKKRVLFPNITYSFYPVYCNLFSVDYREIPLMPDLSVDVHAFCESKGGVCLANPNAPTSLALPLAMIEEILKAHPDEVVMIDEAYVDFGAQSAVSLIDRYENLLVVQTLSKSRALAGLRVGFAAGNAALIEGLNRVKNSFNSYTLDRLGLAGAAAALEDELYFTEITGKIIGTRQRVADALRNMGFDVPESRANFLFVEHAKKRAADLFALLRENGVIVRYFNKPGIDNRLRISIGTDAEMDRFLKIMEVCIT